MDTCCFDCIDIEQKHPQYEEACRAEFEQVKSGNYNFSGIGLPQDFNDWVDSGGKL